MCGYGVMEWCYKLTPPLSGGVIFCPNKTEGIPLFGKFYLNSAKSLLANALFCTCSRYIFYIAYNGKKVVKLLPFVPKCHLFVPYSCHWCPEERVMCRVSAQCATATAVWNSWVTPPYQRKNSFSRSENRGEFRAALSKSSISLSLILPLYCASPEYNSWSNSSFGSLAS